jgi:hypothetical protein
MGEFWHGTGHAGEFPGVKLPLSCPERVHSAYLEPCEADWSVTPGSVPRDGHAAAGTAASRVPMLSRYTASLPKPAWFDSGLLHVRADMGRGRQRLTWRFWWRGCLKVRGGHCVADDQSRTLPQGGALEVLLVVTLDEEHSD